MCAACHASRLLEVRLVALMSLCMRKFVGDSTGCSRGLLQSTPSPAASTRLAVVRFFLRVEQLLDCTGLCSEAVLCGGGGYLSGCVGTMSTVTAAKRLIPLLDRVLVEKIVPPTRSAGGILLPETTAKLNSGTVIEIGPGVKNKEGNVVPLDVKKGDTVLLPEYGGSHVKLAGKEYVLYRHDDLLGILEQ